MLAALGSVVLLGIAGVDPVAALLALAALAAGATRRGVVAFAAVCTVVPVALGIALSALLAGTGVEIALSSSVLGSPWRALVEAVGAVALLLWALRRARGPRRERARRGGRPTSTGALAALGALYGVTFVTDPTYLAVVVIAGGLDPWALVVSHATWSAISQLPLVVVGVAVATGRDQAVRRLLARVTDRWGPALRTALTVVIAVTALVLVTDVVTWTVTGSYLLGG